MIRLSTIWLLAQLSVLQQETLTRAIAGGFWGGVTLVTGAISNFFFRPSGGGKVTVEEVVKQE